MLQQIEEMVEDHFQNSYGFKRIIFRTMFSLHIKINAQLTESITTNKINIFFGLFTTLFSQNKCN